MFRHPRMMNFRDRTVDNIGAFCRGDRKLARSKYVNISDAINFFLGEDICIQIDRRRKCVNAL